MAQDGFIQHLPPTGRLNAIAPATASNKHSTFPQLFTMLQSGGTAIHGGTSNHALKELITTTCIGKNWLYLSHPAYWNHIHK
jgi:hypothetical protein